MALASSTFELFASGKVTQFTKREESMTHLLSSHLQSLFWDSACFLLGLTTHSVIITGDFKIQVAKIEE